MDVTFAERACETCRQRRVKCDKRLPGCQRCESLGRPCSGYRAPQIFLDESNKVRQKYHGSNHQKDGFSAASRSHVSCSFGQTPVEAFSLPQTSSVQASSPLSSESPHSATADVFSDSEPPFIDDIVRGSTLGSKTPPGTRRGDRASARLINNEPDYSLPVAFGTSGSLLLDDGFFDLDVETYYANGNNACGFIPGAPVILNTDDFAMDESISGDYDTLGWGEESPQVQSHTPRDSQARRQSPPSDKIREIALLLRHFVETIAPSMDIFDSDAYFGRHFPFKAKHNTMLRAAIAAVAARQIAKTTDNQPCGAAIHSLSSVSAELGGPGIVNWYYKAANYYDAGISYLRLHLERCCVAVSPASSLAQSSVVSSSPAEGTPPSHSTGREPPHKRSRTDSNSHPSSPDDMEDLLSAIAVFSLYESMSGYSGEWKQHVAGFKSLLRNQILPRAALQSLSSDGYLASGAVPRSGIFARADFLAAYEQQSFTQMDPDDMVMWKAAGLRLPAGLAAPDSGQSMSMSGSDGREDDACRNLIWVLARIMNYLASGAAARPAEQSLDTWIALRSHIQQWHEGLPVHFRPYVSLPIQEKVQHGKSSGPTPRLSQLFYNMPMCAVASQLYHFAQILLLMNRPIENGMGGASRLRMFRKISQEIEHHSRQICGIALGLRTCPAVLEQMIHPIYLAGVCLEGDEDRSVVVKLLKQVETETGRSTTEPIRELQSTWGWEEAKTPRPK